jgi:hypothetical protein
MVATLVDTDETRGDLSKIEQDLAQAVTQRQAPAKKAAAPAQQKTAAEEVAEMTTDLPAKLRGKTPQQIAEMYVNLESAYGRMANDLGQQRKLTDRLLDLKRDTDIQQNTPPKKVEIKSSDLLENPTEALERFSEARESQNQARLAELEARLAAQTLVQAHPDYLEVAQSPEFAAWVQASPIRVRAVRAAQSGDWSAAGDLLTEYKSQKPATKVDETDDNDQQQQTEAQARKAAAAASLESSSQGSSGAQKSGKIYRRVDLMRLRAEKPDTYYGSEFQAEILRAYAEGRVK